MVMLTEDRNVFTMISYNLLTLYGYVHMKQKYGCVDVVYYPT